MEIKESFREKIMERAVSDPNFKAELKQNPKGVLERELGEEFSKNIEFKVVENTPEVIYLVIPCTEEFSDEKLAAIAGGTGPNILPLTPLVPADKEYIPRVDPGSRRKLPPTDIPPTTPFG